MGERRRFERKAASIRVEIMHPSIGTIIGSTQDISDGGASVQVDSYTIPPVGTKVNVRFIKVVGAINQEPVKMNVMYQQRNTIGLMFA
ncbi:TonB-dependent receptor [Candidatus Endobugula sertula]|uniref:TonB-dependent receptor n=1 Tax=Candidatus Endobugula sertula TaxID=62101 RepID=A0A1D2QND1_9GAMM|nr:TonB-dependent receptor [Candidatus Endobugula sertula]